MVELELELFVNEGALADLQVEVNNLKESKSNANTKIHEDNADGSCGSCPDIDELKTDIENILRSDASGKSESP